MRGKVTNTDANGDPRTKRFAVVVEGVRYDLKVAGTGTINGPKPAVQHAIESPRYAVEGYNTGGDKPNDEMNDDEPAGPGGGEDEDWGGVTLADAAAGADAVADALADASVGSPLGAETETEAETKADKGEK